MTEPDHGKLRRLFDLALAAPRAERRALLERECAGDPDLLRRLLAMLAAEEDERFLASPTGGEEARTAERSADAALPREEPGTRIGPYTIVRQIGEGGFGAVFLAEQSEPVRRTVALKILKLGMDTREVVARFEQERQALALMNHPNIARVIDAGATATGRPYFVMDFVEGEPIAHYCDRHSLPLAERLELFAQVCLAVQHAHGKGIIHRDLKPSNILVGTQDGQPTVKIIDFGIAKAISRKLTDKTVFTEERQVIGTVQYMSPEQAEGSLDVDTRADVYALGVVLYELLTGSTPFDAKTLRDAMYGEIQRMIREVEPPKPSTRLSQSTDTLPSIAACRRVEPGRLGAIVRGELDWIVMKALEKDPARRYATADGFAADVRRYLGGEPVAAAPPSHAYRFRKFLRRNRVAATAAAAVALSLLVGVVAFAWQASVARRERDRAIVAEAESEKRAKELALVSEFQASMLEHIDPTDAGLELGRDLRKKHASALERGGVAEADRPDHVRGLDEELLRVNATDTALDLIDETLLTPAVQAISARFSDQPLVEAKLRRVLGSQYAKLGRADEALPLLEAALSARRGILGDDHPDTLTSIQDLASLLETRGEYSRAEKLYREVLSRRRRVLGPDHADTLSSLSSLGGNLRFQGNLADAEPMLREALAGLRRVRGESARDTLICEGILGYLLIDEGKLAEAEPLWRETYEKGRATFGPEDADSLVWTNNLGGLLSSMGRHADAETNYREAYETTRRVRGEEHPGTLSCASNLAWCLSSQGRYTEAEPIARKTLEACQRLLGESHPQTLDGIQNLGEVLSKEGRLAEAEPYLRRSMEIYRQTHGKEHPESLNSASALASLLQSLGRLDEAEALLRELLRTPRTVWNEDHPERLVVMNNLAGLLIGKKEFAEAQELLRAALASRLRVSGPEHPETLVVQNGLARILKEQGKLADAESLSRDTAGKFRKALGDDHPNTARSLQGLGDVLVLEGKVSEADPLLREALTTLRKSLGDEHVRVGFARLSLGRELTAAGRFAESETELIESHRVLSSAQGVTPADLEDCKKALVALYEGWERADPGQGHGAGADRWR